MTELTPGDLLRVASATETAERQSDRGAEVSIGREVDALAAQAKKDGLLKFGPTFLNPYAGYVCIVSDPDGNRVEFSYGQALGESDTHSEAQQVANPVVRSQPTRN